MKSLITVVNDLLEEEKWRRLRPETVRDYIHHSFWGQYEDYKTGDIQDMVDAVTLMFDDTGASLDKYESFVKMVCEQHEPDLYCREELMNPAPPYNPEDKSLEI